MQILACQHGTTAAARRFSMKLGRKVSISTVDSIKQAYLETAQNKRTLDSDDDVSILPPMKHGRPFIFGEDLDKRIQLYLKKVRDGGGVVTAAIVVAAV